MASNLSQAKSSVLQIGNSAQSTANQLNALAQNLEKYSGSVDACIGGTAGGEDKEIADSFMRASKAVKEAASLLADAASKAKNWAAKA